METSIPQYLKEMAKKITAAATFDRLQDLDALAAEIKLDFLLFQRNFMVEDIATFASFQYASIIVGNFPSKTGEFLRSF